MQNKISLPRKRLSYRVGKIPHRYKDKYYTRNTYRRAKPQLRRCYGDRCGYSMVHANYIGGKIELEVDHFNPSLKKRKKQRFSGFVLSSGHCNRMKDDTWPTSSDRRDGFYLLDPRKELVYERHVRENKETGELIPVTRAGHYHIEVCDLNAPHLCDLRSRRTKLREYVGESHAFITKTNDAPQLVEKLGEVLSEIEVVPKILFFEGELNEDGLWMLPLPNV